MKKMNLIFASHKASMKSLGMTDRLVVVPLNAIMMLEPEYESYYHAKIASWFSPADFEAMHVVVESLWNEFKACYKGKNPEYFSYEFHMLGTQVVYYQNIVQEALKRYQPAEVFLFDCETPDNRIINNTERIFSTLIFRIIVHEVSNLKKTYLKKQPFTNNRKIERLLSVWTNLLFRPSGLYARLFQRARPLYANNNPIVYYGQISKGILLKQLIRRNWGWNVNAIDHFLKMPKNFSINYKKSEDIKLELIQNFVNYATCFENELDQCARIAKGPWTLLLTCNQVSPLGRCLVDSFLAEGKAVALFAEGLGQQNKEMNQYIENVFYWPPAATGFLLSEYILNYYREKGLENSFLVTGYLGSSCDINKIADFCFEKWFRLRNASRCAPNKRVILYALTSLTSYHIARFSCEETPHEVLHHLHEFLSQVDFSRYTVIVKLHGSYFGLEHLKARYRDLDVLWFVNIPWEVLANVANCTVIFHSSVGLESLSMKVPVMVWNPTGRATFANTYLSTESSVLMHVKEKTDIPKALEGLMYHNPEDFMKYDHYLAKNQQAVIPWLRKTLQH